MSNDELQAEERHFSGSGSGSGNETENLWQAQVLFILVLTDRRVGF